MKIEKLEIKKIIHGEGLAQIERTETPNIPEICQKINEIIDKIEELNKD